MVFILFVAIILCYEQLAVVANNPKEQTARQKAMQHYQDKYEAISAFARQLVASLRG